MIKKALTLTLCIGFSLLQAMEPSQEDQISKTLPPEIKKPITLELIIKKFEAEQHKMLSEQYKQSQRRIYLNPESAKIEAFAHFWKGIDIKDKATQSWLKQLVASDEIARQYLQSELFTAVEKLDREKVDLLMACGADINYLYPCYDHTFRGSEVTLKKVGEEPLLIAIIKSALCENKKESVKLLLLEKGADFNLTDSAGNTALSIAEERSAAPEVWPNYQEYAEIATLLKTLEALQCDILSPNELGSITKMLERLVDHMPIKVKGT